jgi:hypothetical protein
VRRLTVLLVLVPAFLAGVEAAGAATWRVTTGADSGAGSLREIVAQVQPGDTISLNGQTVSLGRPVHIDTEGVSVKGPGTLVDKSAVPQYGSGTGGAFALFVSGSNVTVDGVDFVDVPLVISPETIELVSGVAVYSSRFRGRHGVVWVLKGTSKTQVGDVRRGNTFTGSQDAAVTLELTDDTKVVQNTFRNTGDWAIHDSASEGLLLRLNRALGGSVIRVESKQATLDENTVEKGKLAAFQVAPSGAGADDVLLTGNTALESRSHGYLVEPNARYVKLRKDFSLDNRGNGVIFAPGARGEVVGGQFRRNGRAGIYVAAGAVVRISQVRTTSNTWPGIDLDPIGVTPNGSKKAGNLDLDWPERIRWSSAKKKYEGEACPGCRIEVYEIESPPRTGNPKNGEGAFFLAAVTADAAGHWEYPKDGAIECPAAERLTTTTTSGSGEDAHTSEFSPEIDCKSAPPPATGKGGGSASTTPRKVMPPKCPPCTSTITWLIYVPLEVRHLHYTIVGPDGAQLATLWPGVAQSAALKPTGRIKEVKGVKLREVALTLTLKGEAAAGSQAVTIAIRFEWGKGGGPAVTVITTTIGTITIRFGG